VAVDDDGHAPRPGERSSNSHGAPAAAGGQVKCKAAILLWDQLAHTHTHTHTHLHTRALL